ncbi:MAG: FlgD immunoglobulin-like domain containing protein [Calditrichaceae bacterium]
MAVSTKKSRVVISIALLLTVFGFSQAMAQTTYYSQGAVNFTSVTNWNDASDGSGNPPPGTSVFVSAVDDFVVQNTDNLTIDATPTINNLTINTSGTVTNNGFDLQLVGTLTVTQGTVSMSSNFVIAGTVNVNGGTFNAGSSDQHSFLLSLSSGAFNAQTSTIEMKSSGSTTVFNKTGGTFDEGTATFKIVPNSDGSSAILTITSNSNIAFEKLIHSGLRNSGFSNVHEISFAGTVTYSINNSFERTDRASAINFPSGATLSYNQGAKLNYSGSTIAFTVGNEWPASNGPDSVLVTNSSTKTVTLSSSRTIPSDGALVLSQFSENFIIGDGTILTINGVLERKVSGTTGISLSGTGSVQYAATGSSLKYNTSANTTIGAEWPATNSPENVEITILNSNALSSSGDLSRTVTKNLTMNVGTVNLNAGTLAVLGNVAGSEIAGSATINDATTLEVGNSGSGNSQSQTIIGTLTLNKMTVNKTGGANDAANTVQLTESAALTFTAGSSLTVTAGILDLNGASRFVTAPVTMTINSGAVLKTGGTSLTSVATLTATNGKIVFSGSSQETLPIGTIGTVELNNVSGAITSAGTLTVGSSLVLTSGKLITSSANILRLASAATVSGIPSSSNMVVGPLQKAFASGVVSFLYPVGYGSSYRPATFDYLSNDVATSIIQIEAVSGDPGGTKPTGINSIATSHHYVVKEIGTAGTFTYNFTGTYTGTGFTPESRNQLIVQNGIDPNPLYSYPNTIAQTVNTTAKTVKINDALSALPSDDGKIAFGSIGVQITWDGGLSGTGTLWSNAANWVGDIVPQTGDDVLFDHTELAAAYSVTYDGSTTKNEFSSITIAPGGGNNITLTLSRSTTLTLTSSSNALVVGSNGKLTFSGTTVTMGAGFDNTRTDFQAGSTVEYTTGNVHVDGYDNLTISGATSGTTGSGTTTVGGNLAISATGFTSANAFTVAGSFTQTAGAASFATQSLTLNGNVDIQGGTFTPSTSTTFNGSDFQISGSGAVATGSGHITFGGESSQTITDASSASLGFNSVTINKSGNDVTLNNPVSIYGSLTLTLGDIITDGTNIITFETAATASAGSNNSHINGPAKKKTASVAEFAFPIGNGTKWRRIAVTPASSTAETYQAQFYNTNPQVAIGSTLGANVSVVSSVLYWNLTRTGSVNAKVRLFWEDASDGVQAPGSLIVVRWDGSQWVSGGYSSNDGDANSGSVLSSTTFANFGNFTLGSEPADNSLPVELSSFEAVSAFNQVVLSWKTQSELENLGFNVYRARGAEPDNWTQLNEALIPGQGTYTHATDYEYVDRSVAAGETYLYKLESVSVSGLRVDERTIEVAVPVPDQYALFKNYPNPFNPTTNIRFQLPDAQNVKLAVYDIRGSLVKTVVNNQAFPAGEHTVTWDATDNNGSRVASGMYIYRFEAGKFSKIDKMILLK